MISPALRPRWSCRLPLAAFGLVAALILSALPLAAQAECCACTAAANPQATICITTDISPNCAELNDKTTNPEVKKLNCTKLDNSKCKLIASGGLCQSGPISELKYAPLAASGTRTIPADVPLELNVPIPRLKLAENFIVRDEKVIIPYFAQYVSAVQRYLIGIAITAAAIMIVYGGFLYIVASSGAKVSSGKTIIKDAVIGLVLILAAYLILEVVNPNTVQLTSLQIPLVRKQVMPVPRDVYQDIHQVAKATYEPDPEIAERIKSIGSEDARPTRQHPDNPFDTREFLTQTDIDEIANLVSEKTGIEDTCIIKSIIGIESGGRQNAIGHDEDAPLVQVQARLNFLRSGTKKSKTTFTAPDLPDDCSADSFLRSAEENLAECKEIVAATKGIMNDDVVTAEPPDYGLDWRYSHGIGLTQLTIFPNGCKGADGSRGLKVKGVGICWTVPILLTLEGQTELLITALKQAKADGINTPCGFFQRWAGQSGDVCVGEVNRKKMFYEKCVRERE